MPKELSLLEEFDVIMELQFPDFIYSLETINEKVAFIDYISSFSNRRILTIDDDLFNYPFVIAGLKQDHIETLIREGDVEMKKNLIFNLLFNDIFIKEVDKFAVELDNRQKTTENTTRIKNIIQYLKDNKNII